MKIHTFLTGAIVIAACGLLAPSLGAQTLIAVNGINLGGTGNITGGALTLVPAQRPDLLPQGWLTPNKSTHGRVLPVGQFLGVDITGAPLAHANLIPLRTSSVSVVDPDNLVFDARSEAVLVSGLLDIDGEIAVEGA